MTLYEVLSAIKTPEDYEKLFEDLCTYAEIDNLKQRIEAAQLLLKGGTYTQVIQEAGISSATVSRVNRCIQHGSGGYSKILKEILDEQKK